MARAGAYRLAAEAGMSELLSAAHEGWITPVIEGIAPLRSSCEHADERFRSRGPQAYSLPMPNDLNVDEHSPSFTWPHWDSR